MNSLPTLLSNYVSVVPVLIAIINSVIAVWVSYFPTERQGLKVGLLVVAIAGGLLAAAATIAGQHYAIEIANHEREITTQRMASLGQLIEEGDALQGPITDVSAPVNMDGVQAWIKKTEGFLSKGLGAAFVSRFRDYAGVNNTGLPSSLLMRPASDPHLQIWTLLEIKLARLQQFSEELSARIR